MERLSNKVGGRMKGFSTFKSKRQCNNCGIIKYQVGRNHEYKVDGVRTYCGYMRLVKE